MRHCLVVTPIPTVPKNQGNAVNIALINNCLRRAGYHVHMVYSGMEGIDDKNVEAMRREVDRLDVIPFSRCIPPVGPMGFQLDDWFDEAVGFHVGALCASRKYDFVLIHYIWMTALVRFIPSSNKTILYTHDKFTDRHLMLARSGIAPTWFSISKDGEATALNRVDVVLATQEDEAAYFRQITSNPVFVIGSLQALRRRPPLALGANHPLTVGYAGSDNPGNRRSLELLLAAIDKHPELNARTFRIMLAGPISLNSTFRRDYVATLGFLREVDDLYRQVDLMINPSVGGSGLKIKSIEALSNGMTLLSTRDGVTGLDVSSDGIVFEDITELVTSLAKIARSGISGEINLSGNAIISQYINSQVTIFKDIFDYNAAK